MAAEYKPKISPLGFVGLIFAPIGSLFFILGILIPIFAQEPDGPEKPLKIMRLIFCLLGLIFAGSGGGMLAVEHKNHKRIRSLIQAGNYVMAVFTESRLAANITINGVHPHVAILQHTDSFGNLHVFQSEPVMADLAPMLKGREIPVYVEPYNYDNYYVDIHSVAHIH